MANHVLSLEVKETLNCSLLRIEDTSIYADGMDIDCPTLNVTLPGFNYSVEIVEPDIAPGFSKNLTACDLEVQTLNCGTKYDALPDGIYVLRWSVAPNEIVFAEYNHLRLSKIRSTYEKILCEVDINDCAPNSENEKKLKKLREIKIYLDAAKAKVEICHEPKKGMELYTYAKKMLSKFNCTTCY